MGFIEFRCAKCGKLLGRIKGEAEIKCPRCSKLNMHGTDMPDLSVPPISNVSRVSHPVSRLFDCKTI